MPLDPAAQVRFPPGDFSAPCDIWWPVLGSTAGFWASIWTCPGITAWFRVDSTTNTPISSNIILVPIHVVPDQYFWLIGRISAKQSGTCGQSRAITWGGLERSGAIASVQRESCTEKVIGYCFLTCSKPVADQNPSAAGRLGRLRVF